MDIWRDSDYKGNSSFYHTGKKCITKGCENPAGTTWSPNWCQPCNADRIDRISTNLKDIVDAQ